MNVVSGVVLLSVVCVCCVNECGADGMGGCVCVCVCVCGSVLQLVMEYCLGSASDIIEGEDIDAPHRGREGGREGGGKGGREKGREGRRGEEGGGREGGSEGGGEGRGRRGGGGREGGREGGTALPASTLPHYSMEVVTVVNARAGFPVKQVLRTGH